MKEIHVTGLHFLGLPDREMVELEALAKSAGYSPGAWVLQAALAAAQAVVEPIPGGRDAEVVAAAAQAVGLPVSAWLQEVARATVWSRNTMLLEATRRAAFTWAAGLRG